MLLCVFAFTLVQLGHHSGLHSDRQITPLIYGSMAGMHASRQRGKQVHDGVLHD